MSRHLRKKRYVTVVSLDRMTSQHRRTSEKQICYEHFVKVSSTLRQDLAVDSPIWEHLESIISVELYHTSTICPQINSALASRYNDRKLALQQIIRTQTTPANIDQFLFAETNPRCNKNNMMISKTNKNGAKQINERVGNGLWRWIRVHLCANKAAADAVQIPNAMLLLNENKSDLK